MKKAILVLSLLLATLGTISTILLLDNLTKPLVTNKIEQKTTKKDQLIKKSEQQIFVPQENVNLNFSTDSSFTENK